MSKDNALTLGVERTRKELQEALELMDNEVLPWLLNRADEGRRDKVKTAGWYIHAAVLLLKEVSDSK